MTTEGTRPAGATPRARTTERRPTEPPPTRAPDDVRLAIDPVPQQSVELATLAHSGSPGAAAMRPTPFNELPVRIQKLVVSYLERSTLLEMGRSPEDFRILLHPLAQAYLEERPRELLEQVDQKRETHHLDLKRAQAERAENAKGPRPKTMLTIGAGSGVLTAGLSLATATVGAASEAFVPLIVLTVGSGAATLGVALCLVATCVQSRSGESVARLHREAVHDLELVRVQLNDVENRFRALGDEPEPPRRT